MYCKDGANLLKATNSPPKRDKLFGWPATFLLQERILQATLMGILRLALIPPPHKGWLRQNDSSIAMWFVSAAIRTTTCILQVSNLWKMRNSVSNGFALPSRCHYNSKDATLCIKAYPGLSESIVKATLHIGSGVSLRIVMMNLILMAMPKPLQTEFFVFIIDWRVVK